MQRGRSFTSNGSSLESSHRAKRVSIRSSISSTSASDFGDNEDDDDDCAIFSLFLRFVSSPTNSNSSLCAAQVNKYELGNEATCALRLLWLFVRDGLSLPITSCTHPFSKYTFTWFEMATLPFPVLSDVGVVFALSIVELFGEMLVLDYRCNADYVTLMIVFQCFVNTCCKW